MSYRITHTTTRNPNRNHKYIRKYQSKAGNWVYIYDEDTHLSTKRSANKDSYLLDYNNSYGVRPVKTRTSKLSKIANRITGSEYKKAIRDIDKSNAEYSDFATNFRSGRKDTKTSYASRMKMVHNNRVKNELKKAYQNETLAGRTEQAAKKLKKKTKLTASKVQNKVSKALAKLSRK